MRKVDTYLLDLWLGFGKYEETSLRDVIARDPSYFEWCVINVSYFYVTKEEFARIKEEFPDLKLGETAEKALSDKFEILDEMADCARDEDNRSFYRSYDAYEGDYISWLGDNG